MSKEQHSNSLRRKESDLGHTDGTSTLASDESSSLPPRARNLNRIIYVLQSCLLGISYSMIWPSVWPYIESYGRDTLSSKLYYGAAYIAYPLASMVSSFIIKKITLYDCSFKTVLLLLNCFEIVGSLVYTLPYHPVLPVVGRFVAGFGDVFYLLLAKEISAVFQEQEAEAITIQCVASFVLGVIFAPLISLATAGVNFQLSGWRINYLSISGFNTAILFLISQFLIVILLTDVSPYERCCREPETDDITVSKLARGKPSSDESSTFLGRVVAVVYILSFAFVYGFSGGSFELTLPMMYWENFPGNFFGVAAIYAFLATLYGIFLLIAISCSLQTRPRLLASVGLLIASIGQLLLFYYEVSESPSVLATAVGICLSLAILWAIDDVLFIGMVMHLVPLKHQDGSQSFRRAVSKLAFALSGILIPLAYPRLAVIAPAFILANVVLFVVFHVLSCALSGKYFG